MDSEDVSLDVIKFQNLETWLVSQNGVTLWGVMRQKGRTARPFMMGGGKVGLSQPATKALALVGDGNAVTDATGSPW